MTEIKCNACGSPNPSQSRYCNRCGASLASETTQLCPTCDTPNPINLLYCDNCGTRLVDDTSEQEPADDEEPQAGSRSEPFSLPARPPGQTGNLDVSGDLPDWLVTGDFAEDDFHNLADEDELHWLRAAQEDETWEDDEAPTLEELSQEHTPRDDLPTWLMDEESESVIFPGDKSTDELFMESLSAGEAHEEKSPVEEPSGEEEPAPDHGEAAADELVSWLSDLEEEEGEDEFGEGSASDLSPPETEAGEEPEESQEEMSEDNFLQWLSGIQEEEVGAGDRIDAPEEAADVPAWLSKAVPELDPDADPGDEAAEEDFEALERSGEPAEESESGDEFIAAAGQETQLLHGSKAGAEEVAEDDFLHWLDSLDEAAPGLRADENLGPLADDRSLHQGEPEQALDEISDAPQATEPSFEVQEEPDEGIDEPEVAEFSQQDFALPDWLGDLSGSEVDAEEAHAQGPEDLPDWLQDLAPPGAGVALPYVSGSDAEVAADDQAEESDADFIARGDDIEEGELPDWLDGVSLEGELTGEDEGEGTDVEMVPERDADRFVAEDDLQESELPDWLDGVTSELEAPPQMPAADDASDMDEIAQDAFAQDEISDQAFEEQVEDEIEKHQVSSEDLPDWFSDVLADIESADEQSVTSDASEMSGVPEQLAGSDLPEWLDSPFGDDEEAAEPTPMEEIPEWLRAPLQEQLARAAAERGVDEASLESGDEWRDLLQTPPASTERGDDSAGRENAMAWLEEIRARTPAEDVAHSEPDPDAEEPGSPIDGIGDALDASYHATPAYKMRSRTEESIAKEQEQQVLLLRQMARGERVQTTEILPLATDMGALPSAARAILTLLLLVVVLLGLVGGDAINALIPQSTDSPATTPMEIVLNGVSGEPVLVVFDYTPSMAGALQPVAVDVMQRLQEGESIPLITSQSAAGLALAAQATNEIALTDVGDLGLVTGGALGVRQVGRCMQEGAHCQTLFGQPVSSEMAAQMARTATVVLITGERDNLVAWIEQLEGIDSVRLAAVITPMLEPVAAPYLLSEQLSDVVVANGASTVDATTRGNNTSAALALSHWFAVVAIAAGALFYLISDTVRSVRG